MKNDITYEYRVFTNRLIDVEAMEVGICTSKVVKELNQKNKVDGRFFHTSDTDEWFFCWNGELQKLNLKGDSDVNAALAEVEKLIADANVAVEDAKKTATESKTAAAEAQAAAEATAAADATSKADAALKSAKEYADGLAGNYETAGAAAQALADAKADAASLYQVKGDYATNTQVNAKQDTITDLETIRSGAAAGATALQAVPEEYVTETELTGKGYLTANDFEFANNNDIDSLFGVEA